MKISPGTMAMIVADVLLVGGVIMVILFPGLWELGGLSLVLGLIIFIVALLKGT